jgi:hypothetical protein
MKKSFILFFSLIFFESLISGCAPLFPKPEPPPPLPVIEEPKPQIKVKSDYFKAFPWSELGKPSKDGNEPNTKMYTWRDDDTFAKVAEAEMGNPAWGNDLAKYNDIADPSKVIAGDKIVIPNPIVGLEYRMVIKRLKEKAFGAPEPVDTPLKKGDEYKFSFLSNVNGYLYVFKQSPKEVELLYPAQVKKGHRNRRPERLQRDDGKITADVSLVIPSTPKGLSFDPKRSGDRVWVYLSLKPIQGLEELKDKAKISEAEVDEVMRDVKAGDIVSSDTATGVKVIRMPDPSKDILGFTLNISG